SMARLVRQPGQNTSSHGLPASSAARIVGDHSMSLPAASCSFQRSTTALASAGAGPVVSPALGAGLDVEPPRLHPHHGPHSPLCAFLDASRRRTDGAGGRFSISPTLCRSAVLRSTG